MFQYFTEKAIKVIMLAQEEARRTKHCYVGPEMMFLGLVAEETAISSRILKSLGISYAQAQAEIDSRIGKGQTEPSAVMEIPFTTEAKAILERSVELMKRLGDNYIGTEHLLLALIEVPQDNVSPALSACGVAFNDVEAGLLQAMQKPFTSLSEVGI